MAEGERAGEKTKDFFKQFTDATESIRQNINSFADGLISDKPQHAGEAGDTKPATSPTTTTTPSGAQQPAAARDLQSSLRHGVDDMGRKLDEWVGNKKP